MCHIFVTHKHMDYLMGIIWMVRMICQFMNHGEYKGEAYIYSHKEVLDLIRDMAGKLLLHEAFCLYSERDIFDPYEKHHSTVKDACELAERLNIKNLLLYHTEDKNLTDRERLYLEEGSKYYHGKLFVPDDLESLEL